MSVKIGRATHEAKTRSEPKTLRVSVCSETCIVPSSAANALPILPATTIDVTTGLSSREKARAKTPPTDRLRPSRVNSRTNWIVKAMPTNAEVKRQTPTDLGPTHASCWRVFFQWILPLRDRVMTWPARMRMERARQRYLGGAQFERSVFGLSFGSFGCSSSGMEEAIGLPSLVVRAAAMGEGFWR
ncbi:leucine--tRNA ligase [Striga asiatica]|uniref:Leucine--tRNA ligase n=1 Tax=Striga asiatica TaxID=4170 RepID=A0A5A7RHJ2_STRAF|nr:leucine--tRNA ligase [Striga asiatica]